MRYPAITVLIFLTVNLALIAECSVIRIPCDQLTIQAGIDAAMNGDTVLIADGGTLPPAHRVALIQSAVSAVG